MSDSFHRTFDGALERDRVANVRRYVELMRDSISVDRAEMADDIIAIFDGRLGATEHPASGEVAAIVDGTAPDVGVERPTMSRDECQCPNDCDCEGRFACEAEPSGPGIKGSWECELVVGHDGWHQSGGHRWPEPPAPLADAPDDVEALAAEVWSDVPTAAERDLIRLVLNSDWLAARDADLTARAEARGAKYALLDAAEDCLNIAFACNEDVREWLKERAAASYTRDGADGEADHG